MEEFIRTLIERIEEKAFSLQLKQGIKEPSTHDALLEKFTVHEIKEIINKYAEEYNNGWLDVDVELPPDDKYVLVSFSNFSLPDIARYEEDENGGAFYPGDEERSYVSFGLFVNAWMPLPKQYQKGE